jgi:TolB-like protein/DNA-binding winged helix-turn-helix (wHTH) protein
MGARPQPAPVVRFGSFEADLGERRLSKNGQGIHLQGQPFDVLGLLLEHAGHLVTHQQFRERLWPAGTIVEFDHSLHTAITRLREALGDDREHPVFVETVPRYGYRFMAPVTLAEAVLPASPAATGVQGEAAPRPMARARKVLLAAGAVPLLLAVALFTLYRTDLANLRPGPTERTIPVHAIIVLPFTNLSPEPGADHLAEGLTEAVATELAGLKSLRVLSRVSAARCRDAGAALPAVAREVGADAVVDGALARDGNHVRVNMQLIDTRTGQHLWARAYESHEPDLVALESEIAATAARAIEATLVALPEPARGSR